MKFKGNRGGSAWHLFMAAAYGRRARALLLDTLMEHDIEAITEDASDAAHYANLVLDRREQAEAPVRQKLANIEAQQFRQALTPRCSYTRITEGKLKDGSPALFAGDPCGGKLKPKTRHRVLLGGECDTCGRFYPVPKEPDSAPVSVEAEAAV